MLMDWCWWILLLLLQTRTPLITSTSWPFHISCLRRSSTEVGRSANSRR
ncbi:hypothetical protein QTG54_007931 [Skeletonema marinoi]|uniref:Uncharacterized protein n=1 Tax=Skeletonema marinoi TaxID=267567 RepID=A0AAD8Y920_9STRA|nr:hypothetical protein QTG54_007931 [Skeletonema marinoi]